MGLNLGKLLRNAGTLGTTWMRDQRRAKKKKKRAAELQAQAMREAEEFQNRDLGETAFTGMSRDPALFAAQQQSLAQTQQIANAGYTDTDRTAMQQQLRDAARYEQGQRQSLNEDANARGMGGSGFAMQSQLAAQQAGADRATDTAANMAIAGRDRAQAANQQVAQQAGQMRDQGFGEQAQIAGAQDQYAQFRIGTQGQDFANLQATRGVQAGNLQQQAAAQEASPNADLAVNALATYYSGGLAGNVTGSQPANGVGAPGASTTKGRPQATTPAPPAATPSVPQATPGAATRAPLARRQLGGARGVAGRMMASRIGGGAPRA